MQSTDSAVRAAKEAAARVCAERSFAKMFGDVPSSSDDTSTDASSAGIAASATSATPFNVTKEKNAEKTARAGRGAGCGSTAAGW